MSQEICVSCQTSKSHHIDKWIEAIIDACLPRLRIPMKIESFLNACIDFIFLRIGLLKVVEDYALADIPLRSRIFIEKAQKRGIRIQVLKGPYGYTDHFYAFYRGKKYPFEILPLAEHISTYEVSYTDNKQKTKEHLQIHNFPIAEGKSFWFWQTKESLHFGEQTIGFPLVVKPRNGTDARHVYTNLQTREDLLQALHSVIEYSPIFMVERYIQSSFVHRATVVDFDYTAVIRQVPAHVVGNGKATIGELIAEKNALQQRPSFDSNVHMLREIVTDTTTQDLLSRDALTLESVPEKERVVFLQKDSFLRLGGDLVDVTSATHEDNVALFQKVAKAFDMRVVGIDFMIPDITQSWKTQTCAVLELNSAPGIAMHHYPSEGETQNVADKVVDLYFKYYH